MAMKLISRRIGEDGNSVHEVLSDENAALRRENEALRKMLNRLEWSAWWRNPWENDSEHECCPICGQLKHFGVHAPDCALDALLRGGVTAAQQEKQMEIKVRDDRIAVLTETLKLFAQDPPIFELVTSDYARAIAGVALQDRKEEE
jgi:DNA repair exonuclease SbcCD ATPase subunit